jgi:hypothetical protein
MAFVPLAQKKVTRVLFHPGIGLGFNREQQKQFVEPDIINPELKSAFGAEKRLPGGRMNTQSDQSWRLVCCNFFGVVSQQEMRICLFLHAQSGGLDKGYYAPTLVLDFCRRSVSKSALFSTTNH